MAEISDRLREDIRTSLEQVTLDLEDVSVTGQGRRRVVQLLVDKDGGVGLDEIAAATRVISDLFDTSGELGERPYVLEVSSPGVERPLRLPRHWRRNLDRLVRVTFTDDRPVVQGRIREVGDSTVGLVVSTKGRTRTVTIDLQDVRRAVVQVQFRREERG